MDLFIISRRRELIYARSTHENKCCYLSMSNAKKHWIGKITAILWIAASHSFHTHDGSRKESHPYLESVSDQKGDTNY